MLLNINILVQEEIMPYPLLVLEKNKAVEISDYQFERDPLSGKPVTIVWVTKGTDDVQMRVDGFHHVNIEDRQNPRNKKRIFLDDEGVVQIRK